MFASGLITFRETLEVALVIGIILSFLSKSKQQVYSRFIWIGLGIGLLLSLLLAYVMHFAFGGFTGKSEQIFEGTLMFVTAGFLSWMILWVHRQKGMVKHLHKKVAQNVAQQFPLGLIILTTSAVIREGVETVFYLRAMSVISQGNQVVGALCGILVAIVVGYVIFRFSLHMHITKVFKISGALLLLFGAGLVSHGVHEFQEAGILPLFFFDPLLNVSFLLNHDSLIGSFLRTLFGYTATPSLLETLSYGSYILLIFLLEIWTTRLLFVKTQNAQ